MTSKLMQVAFLTTDLEPIGYDNDFSGYAFPLMFLSQVRAIGAIDKMLLVMSWGQLRVYPLMGFRELTISSKILKAHNPTFPRAYLRSMHLSQVQGNVKQNLSWKNKKKFHQALYWTNKRKS